MADTGKHMSKSKNKSEVKLKYTTIVSQDGGAESKQENNISLQEAFKRYRKAKQKEIRKAKLLRKRNELRKADPAKMEALRKKFVDQAKKYFGYPYARKYWPPDSPEYKSKLFLDCCGLVRQVMRDLTYNFGFIIGPWNQAYMYDTLPKTVVREEDMKPGDLVFISATYYNPKSKKQRHNMTHVEIWLGDGPKTIGARWNNGKVQVWDSYKFTAKSYYNETYHFKSIDTWLKGICESFCSEHRWKRRKYSPSKKSIFHVESDQSLQEQDEPAGDDGDDDNFTVRGNTFSSLSPTGSKSSSPENLDQKQEMPDETDETDDEMCDASPDSEEESDPAEAAQGVNAKEKDRNKKVNAKEVNGTGQEVVEVGNGTMKAARSLSVDLNNRGLYMQNLVGKGNTEFSEENESVTECGICQTKLTTKPESDSTSNDEKGSSRSKEIGIDKEEDNVKKDIEVQQSICGSGADELANRFQKMTVTNTAENSNQNALPKSEKEKLNGQNNSGARPKAFNNKGTLDASQSEASGRMSADIPEEEPAASRTETDMDTMSDISLAESQSRDKGIDTDNPSEVADENSGSDSGKKKGGKKSPGGPKVKLPACSLPSNMTPTFYIGGGNGVSLVEGPLTSLGWKRTTDKYDERFKLKWVECKSKINYGAFREGDQLVNHLPNSNLLTNKLGLLNSLKEYERVTLSTKGRLPRLKMSEFHPETYKLDEKSDRELFLEVYKESEIWICKPVGMNQGKGIFLVRSREAINQVLEEREQKKQEKQKPGRPLVSRIVQRYILNPLLLEERKFDVRAYMLVASTVPFLILYHKGYVRLTLAKYDESDQNLGVHLTNQFVQKKDPAYKEVKENTAWSMDKFNHYINTVVRPKSHVEIEEDWVYNTFTKQMQKIMIHCFNSVKHKLQQRVGFFDLFGLDFMVDTDMKVHLIEVNTNPALHCNCEALKEVIPGVVEEALYVAIEAFEKSRKNLPLMPLQSLKNFTILYCGTRPNTIIPRQSRSVSPVKENAERPKFVPTGLLQRTVQRASTQSTPLYTSSHRRSSEKNDSNHNTASGTKEEVSKSAQPSKSANPSGNVKKSSKSKSVEDTQSKKTDKDASKTSSEETELKVKEPTETEDSNTDTNKDNKESEETETVVKAEPSKAKVSVVDTLTKTTDSLKEATSALGRLSMSLNQVGIADSLLEEVRLKMTHAENMGSGATPNSATTATRERENLERGN